MSNTFGERFEIANFLVKYKNMLLYKLLRTIIKILLINFVLKITVLKAKLFYNKGLDVRPYITVSCC